MNLIPQIDCAPQIAAAWVVKDIANSSAVDGILPAFCNIVFSFSNHSCIASQPASKKARTI